MRKYSIDFPGQPQPDTLRINVLRKIYDAFNGFNESVLSFNKLENLISRQGDAPSTIYEGITPEKYLEIAQTESYESPNNSLWLLTISIQQNQSKFGASQLADSARGICVSNGGNHRGNRDFETLVQAKFLKVWANKNDLKLENSDAEEA